jgi:hypothetical protein
MKRLMTSAAVAAMLVAGTGSGAHAQELDTKVPIFEIGVYGGGAYTTDWLGINDEFTGFGTGFDTNENGDGFGFGFTPIFGATASFYTTPLFGIRLHGAYMPSDFPTRDDDEDGLGGFGASEPFVTSVNRFEDDDSDYPLNNYFADLSLVFRPWITSRSGFLGSAYLFAGGGVLVTDVAGEADRFIDPNADPDDFIDCVDAYQRIGACLSFQPEYATVGQGTLGIGFNFLPLGNTFGLYGEIAAHGYDSPFHTPDEDDRFFTSTLAEDEFAFTTRAVLGLKAAFGDLTEPVVVAPPVAPAPAPAPPPAPPAPVERAIRVCVVEGTALTEVDAVVVEGDTLVTATRRPFAQAYPAVAPAYASGEAWYINNEPVRLLDREYVKFGVPRVISPNQLSRVGEFQGVGIFAESGASTPQQVLYVPLRPGCEFQPYQLREQIRVRG